MNPVWVISKRELNSYFDSLIAYLILVAFLGFTGFFTWMDSNADVFFRQQASLDVFFAVAQWTLFFFIPAITMRQLAEEKRSGTIELLLTKRISDRQLVVGKFLACLLIVAIALLFTLPYYFTIAKIGPADHGAIISGYFGLLLMSAAYISIGIFASSLTNNQIVALLLALFIGIFFHMLFDIMASGETGFIGDFFSYLSVRSHFESIARGVIDSKDLIFFFSLILIGLLFSEIVISKRK